MPVPLYLIFCEDKAKRAFQEHESEWNVCEKPKKRQAEWPAASRLHTGNVYGVAGAAGAAG